MRPSIEGLKQIYRAKTDDGFWEYGCLVVGAKRCYIVNETEKIGRFEFVEIRIETASRSVDYSDTMGRLLFEGDKIKSSWGRLYTVVIKNGSVHAEDRNGFLYRIEDIHKPMLIGNKY